MDFKKLYNKVDKILEEYEENIDEEEVPPWFGSKGSDSGGTSAKDSNDTPTDFNLDRTDSETTIQVYLPGYPEDNIAIHESNGNLHIEVSETEEQDSVTYEYQIQSDEDISGVDVTYENGLLSIQIPRQ